MIFHICWSYVCDVDFTHFDFSDLWGPRFQQIFWQGRIERGTWANISQISQVLAASNHMATGHDGCRHQGFNQSGNNQHTRRLINTRRHLKPPGSSQLWLIWDGSLLFSHLHETDRSPQEDFHFPFPQLKKGIFNWMFWKLEEQTTLRHLPKVSDFTDTCCACWFRGCLKHNPPERRTSA